MLTLKLTIIGQSAAIEMELYYDQHAIKSPLYNTIQTEKPTANLYKNLENLKNINNTRQPLKKPPDSGQVRTKKQNLKLLTGVSLYRYLK